MRTGSTQQQAGPPKLTGDFRASLSHRVLKTKNTKKTSNTSSTSNTSTRYAVLWEFAREVVRDHGRELSAAEVKALVRDRFPDAPVADTTERLTVYIGAVKYLPGDGPWERAVVQARTEPPPAWAEPYSFSPELHFFCCLIEKLPPCAKGKKKGLIKLRQRSIADELDVRQTRVSRLIAVLRHDGVLQLVHEAVPHKTCALYRFHPPNRGAS